MAEREPVWSRSVRVTDKNVRVSRVDSGVRIDVTLEDEEARIVAQVLECSPIEWLRNCSALISCVLADSPPKSGEWPKVILDSGA